MKGARAESRGICWRLYFALALLPLLSFAAPAMAQGSFRPPPVPSKDTVMRDDGMALPAFFFSRAEQAARRTCEAELPECRDSIRRQLATEKAVSRMIPWILLCIAIWGAVRYVNRREKNRQQSRQEAARHHVRASVREREAKEARVQAREGRDEEEDKDGFGMGLGDDDNAPPPRRAR